MYTQIYYLVRSKLDGSYLVARPNQTADQPQSTGYLLLFTEHFEALSYLNTHAADVADRFGIEPVPGAQVEGLLKRWGFEGIGIVQDPLVPGIEFLTR